MKLACRNFISHFAGSSRNWHIIRRLLSFWGSKMIDPRPYKGKRQRFDKSTNVRYAPSVPIILP